MAPMNDHPQQHISSPNSLKRRIMRRIYRVYIVRSFAPFTFDCLGIITLAFVATLLVSVKDVYDNLSTAQDSGQLGSFSFSALADTELTTKLILVVLGIVGYITYRHFKRAVYAVRTLRESTESKQNAALSAEAGNTEQGGDYK